MAKLETVTNEGALLFSRMLGGNVAFKFKGCKCYSNPSMVSSITEAKALKASNFSGLTPALQEDYIEPIEALPIAATNPTTEMSRDSEVDDMAIELNFNFQGVDQNSDFNQICLYGSIMHFCIAWNPNVNYGLDDAVFYVREGGVKAYYRCIQAIEHNQYNPAPYYDSIHWVEFAIDGPNDYDATYDEKNGLVQYNVDSDNLIYFLQFSQSIKAISGIFIDWKIRLFLNSAIFSRIYTEGVEMDPATVAQAGAMQLEFIKELSDEMRVTRDLLRNKLGI